MIDGTMGPGPRPMGPIWTPGPYGLLDQTRGHSMPTGWSQWALGPGPGPGALGPRPICPQSSKAGKAP